MQITIRSGYSNSKGFKRLIWDYKKWDYNIMKPKILEFDWDALIKREPDIDKACINFTNVILSVSEECIPRREVTIRCNDKIWFDSNIRNLLAWFLIRTTYIQQVGSLNLRVF
jgi:hypothetical protein